MDNRKQIGKLLNSHSINGIGAEIGVANGEFSSHILKTSTLSLLISIDIWKDEGTMNRARRLLKKHQDRSVCYQALSHKAAELFPDECFDFIYIDANHCYRAVKSDLRCWWPKLRRGGLFAGHDYFEFTSKSGCVFGVVKAVNEFVAKHNCGIVHTTTENFAPSWYFFKGEVNIKHL